MATADSKNSADVITPAPEIQRDHDRAADFLASHGDTSFTVEEEKAVLRKIDMRVLVLLLWAYFFQQLDKSTLRNWTTVVCDYFESPHRPWASSPVTSIFGIVDDAHLVGKEYSWLGSILYLAQLVMQPVAAVLLVKLPNGKVIASAVFLWGSALCLMSACTNFASLLGLRFVLGTFEAMIAPCCVAITQMWWRRGEQTLRTSYWNAMNGVTSIIGSLFTYGLGHIESKTMFKYQIIFLFCGLLTVAYSILVFILMPDSPMEAKFISEREKVIATERLRANQMGVASRTWRWDHVWETAYDLKTWLWFIAIIAISISSGGITTFGSLIVKSFGYSSFQTILFNIPFGAIQVISIIGSGWIAQRIQRKGLVITAISVLPTIGTVLLLTVPRHQKGVLLFGYYLVSCLAAITPMLFNWQAVNSGGDTKKKCTSAVVFIGMCAGNVIGPLLYSTDQAPLYRAGLISNLIMFVLVGIIAAIIPFYLMFLNKRHAKRREELGKSAVIIDESMISKDKMQASKAVEVEDAQIPQHRTLAEDRGLLDLTDLKNEDFVYVY